jgi:hypothetical protein
MIQIQPTSTYASQAKEPLSTSQSSHTKKRKRRKKKNVHCSPISIRLNKLSTPITNIKSCLKTLISLLIDFFLLGECEIMVYGTIDILKSHELPAARGDGISMPLSPIACKWAFVRTVKEPIGARKVAMLELIINFVVSSL